MTFAPFSRSGRWRCFALATVSMALLAAPPAPAPAQITAGEESLAATELLPLDEGSMRMRVLEGDGAGGVIRQTLEPLQGGRWLLTFGEQDRLVLREDESGIVVDRIELLDEGRGVLYDPAIPLLPAELRPGESVEMTSQATLFDLETDEVTDRGTATHRVHGLSRASFQTSEGVIRGGYLADLDHRIDLDLADVRLVLDLGFQPGRGIVYRRTRSTVEKLGMFGDTSSRTVVAVSDEAAE